MVRCWVLAGAVELVCPAVMPAAEHKTRAARQTKRLGNGRTGNSLGTGAAKLQEAGLQMNLRSPEEPNKGPGRVLIRAADFVEFITSFSDSERGYEEAGL